MVIFVFIQNVSFHMLELQHNVFVRYPLSSVKY